MTNEQIIEVADYIITHDCTIKDASKHFGYSSNKLSYHIWHYLRDIDENKFNLIREGFKRHRSTKKQKQIWKDISNLCTDGSYLFKLDDGTCCFGMHYKGINYKEGDQPIVAYAKAEQFIPKKLK